MNNLLLKLAIFRKKQYREEYKALSEEDKDAHFRLMKHYSVYGGPLSARELHERCEAAQQVDNAG